MAVYNITSVTRTDGMDSNSAIGSFQNIELTIDTDIPSASIGNVKFYLRVGTYTNQSYSDSNGLPSSNFYYFENLAVFNTYNFSGRWQAGPSGDKENILSNSSFISTDDNGGNVRLIFTAYFQNFADLNGNWGSVSSPTNRRFVLTKDSFSNSSEIDNSFPSDVYSIAKNLNVTFWLEDSGDVNRSNGKVQQTLRYYNRDLNANNPQTIEEIEWELQDSSNNSINYLSSLNDTRVFFRFNRVDAAYPIGSIDGITNRIHMFAIKTNNLNAFTSPYDSLEESVAELNGAAPVTDLPFSLNFPINTGIFETGGGTSSNGCYAINANPDFESFVTVDPTKLTVGDTYRFIYHINLPNGSALNSNQDLPEGRNDFTFISPEYEVVEDTPDPCNKLDTLNIKRVELCDYFSCYINNPNFAPGERIKQIIEIDFGSYNNTTDTTPFDVSTASIGIDIIKDNQIVESISKPSISTTQTGSMYRQEYEYRIPIGTNPSNWEISTRIIVPQNILADDDVLTFNQRFRVLNRYTDLDINFTYENDAPFSLLCEGETENIKSCATHNNISQSSELEADTNFHMSGIIEENSTQAYVEEVSFGSNNFSDSDSLFIVSQFDQYSAVDDTACSIISTPTIIVDRDYDVIHYRKSRGYGLDFSGAQEVVRVNDIREYSTYDDFSSNSATAGYFEMSFYLKEIRECVLFAKYSLNQIFGFEFGINASGQYYLERLKDGNTTRTNWSSPLPVLGWNYVYYNKPTTFGTSAWSTGDGFLSVNNSVGQSAGSNGPPVFKTHLFINYDNQAIVNNGPFTIGNKFGFPVQSAPIILSSFYFGRASRFYNTNITTEQFDKGINRTPNVLAGEQGLVLGLRFNKNSGFSVCDFSENGNDGSLIGFGNRTAINQGAWVIK